jgi:uncharacterized membrane protein
MVIFQKQKVKEQWKMITKNNTYNEVNNSQKINPIRITITALFIALNIAFSSFGLPVPGGHVYLCDMVICLAALILNPFESFIVGGVGSFLGDLIFYPLTMFVSLITHGLQALVISLIAHHSFKDRPKLASIIAVIVGGLVMVLGYTLGKAFVYSTKEYAILTMPYEITQTYLGAILSIILAYRYKIKASCLNLINRHNNRHLEATN